VHYATAPDPASGGAPTLPWACSISAAVPKFDLAFAELELRASLRRMVRLQAAGAAALALLGVAVLTLASVHEHRAEVS
jgi:hypothetical protein